MKLLYVIPGSGMAPEEMNRRTRVLQDHAFSGTTVSSVCDTNPDGVMSIESYYEDALATPFAMKSTIEAEKKGYDGVIIGCAGDPGLFGCREMVKIPVVGPGENAVHQATMLGNKFSVIAIVDSCVPRHYQLIRRAGICSDRVASVRAANVSVLDIARDPTLTRKRVIEEATAARDIDGADVVVLGCLSLAFQLFDRELSEILGLPVINPALSALKTLESLVSIGIGHSKIAFRVPPKFRS